MTSKNLRTIVYHLLLEAPHTGYSIAKEAEARTGWKPSWGSIYPLLESMQNEGLIEAEEKGRSKEYTLTEKGTAIAKEHVTQTKEILGEIIERLQVLQEFCDEDLSIAISSLKEMQQTGKSPVGPIRKETVEMNQEIYRLYTSGLLKKNSTYIKEILENANQELRGIQ